MLLETTALGRTAARIMEQATFAEHYRICAKGDGSPRELSRTGSAITCKAKDIRSGEPVALKLIPIASVDSAAREQFEEQACAAQLLDHINIAKVCAFGVEDHHFVFVSEYLEGETADSWITAHGPMALDAVLRIALQVVSARAAAGSGAAKTVGACCAGAHIGSACRNSAGGAYSNRLAQKSYDQGDRRSYRRAGSFQFDGCGACSSDGAHS
jgi:hypothetical protein